MSAAPRLGIVAGLDAEARIARRVPGAEVRVAGASAARAADHARSLVAAGIDALVSFGIAGGLAPGIAPGTLVLASAVIEPGGKALATDAAWASRLAGRLPSGIVWQIGDIAGAAEPLADVAAKAALFRATRAVAVDMESLAVAEAGATAGLPVLVVRAIADPASRGLPASALAAVDRAGRVRPFAALAGLARRPGEIRGLYALARESRAALRTLGRVAALVGPTFAVA